MALRIDKWDPRKSQSLKWQSQNRRGSVLDSVHICYDCVTWYSFETLYSGNRMSLTLSPALGTFLLGCLVPALV